MKNFNPRTLLWLIFASSLILLWSNYQASLAPKTAAPTAQSATQNGANPAAPAGNGAAPSASLTLAGQPLVLENDVLQLNVNTQGGVVQYAMLKKFFNSENHALNTVLFNSKTYDPNVIAPNEMYASRSGLSDVGLDHTTMFTPNAQSARLQDGQNDVSLVLTAQNNGVTLKKTYTLKRGSYLMDVHYEVENGSAQAIKPDVYMELVRDGSQIGNSQFYTTYTGPVVYNEDNKFKKVPFDEIAKDKHNYTDKGNSGWVGMLQHYFVSAWVVP